MSAIINGLGIGLFSAIFVSMYISNFTPIVLPIYMIYGILAPLISAVSITVLILSKRQESRYNKDKLQWFEENK